MWCASGGWARIVYCLIGCGPTHLTVFGCSYTMESNIIETVTEVASAAENTVQTVTDTLSHIVDSQPVIPGGFDVQSSAPVNLGVSKDLFAKNFSKMVIVHNGTFSGGEKWGQITTISMTTKLRFGGKPFDHLAKMWKAYKADLVVRLQCNVAAGASGGLLLVHVPPGQWGNRGKWSLGTIFNLPHAIQSLGKETSMTLRIPFTSFATMYRTDPDDTTLPDSNPDFALYQIAPYRHTNGMLTSADYVILCGLENLVMSIPRLIPQGPNPPPGVNEKSRYTRFKYHEPREIITESDGAANLANAHSTGSNISSALAGERIYISRNSTGSHKRVEDLLEIAKIFSCPIDHDSMEVKNEATFDWTSSNTVGSNIYKMNLEPLELGNIGAIGRNFVGFSGSIDLEIRVFASSLHHGRIAIVVEHEPQESNASVTVHTLSQLNYTILDLDKDAIATVKIPYMYSSWMRRFDRINYIRVYVVVVARLSASSVANNTVTCLVRFKAGDDFKFYFPREDSIVVQGLTSWGSEMDLVDPIADEATFQESSAVPNKLDIVPLPVPDALGVVPSTYKISAVSYSQMDLITGRSMFITDHQYQADTSTVHVPLHVPKSGHAMILHMFCYWAGEVNITVSNESDNNLVMAHSYDELPGRLEGAGALVVPARRIITFTAPFYSPEPLRPVSTDEPVFGHLYVNCGYLAGSFKVWVSCRNSSFFLPAPIHKAATLKGYLENIHLYNPTMEEAVVNFNRYKKGESKVVSARVRPTSGIRYVKDMLARDNVDHSDILLGGDIEENPGPVYEVVYKQRGLYKHYGARCGDTVYHLNSEDILYTAFTGNATIISEPYTDIWIPTGQTSFNPELPPVGEHMKFAIDSNCETFVDDFLNLRGWSQERILQWLGGSLLAASLASAAMMQNQDFGTVFTMIGDFITNTMSKHIISKVLKFLLRLVLYSVLFAHGPCLATGGALAGLLTMDLIALQENNNHPWVKGFFRAAIAGDVAAMVENISHGIEERDEQENAVRSSVDCANSILGDQALIDDFNKFTMGFKNLDWWLQTLQTLVNYITEKFKPTEKQKFLKLVKTHEGHLASLLTAVAKLKDEARTPNATTKRAYIERLEYTDSLVNHWLEGFITYCPKHEMSGILQSAKRTLQSIVTAPAKPGGTTRPEPLGIYVHGDPGCGKSFFVSLLAKLVRKEMGWDGDNIYYHPTGSQYMDSYDGQDIHIIDDLGQAADDEEYKLLCQMISSMHFQVPMAKLEEKGTWYTSKLVIATSNRNDFVTKTLNSTDALARRFQDVIKIKPASYCSANGKLDVVHGMSMIKKGVAWTNDKGQVYDMKALAVAIADKIRQRFCIADDWEAFLDEGVLEWDDWETRFWNLADKATNTIFDEGNFELPTPWDKFTSAVKKSFEKASRFLDDNFHWLIFIQMILGVIGLICFIMAMGKKNGDKEEGYDGKSTVLPKKTKFQKKGDVLVDQGPLDDKAHLMKVAVRLEADGKEVFGLAIGGSRLLTYGHSSKILEKSSEIKLCYKGFTIPLEEIDFQPIKFNGKETDLAIVDTKSKTAMASGIKNITGELGTENILLWNTKYGVEVQSVSHARRTGAAMTVEGTQSHDTITYNVNTAKGSCGGLLCTKIGGMYKIVGMHVAGNGLVGRAVSLPMTLQGNFFKIDKLPLPKAHLNTRSQLKPSPVYECVPVKKGPAVLTKFDPRVKDGADPRDQIVLKNVGNVYNPDPRRMKIACENVAARLSECVGVHEPISLSAALFDLKNPVDMSTSAGHKYTSKGLTKKKLFDKNTRYISEVLIQDVRELEEDLRQGRNSTYFTTALKDELRTIEKIEIARTRVIEASNFDYTCLFRRYLGVPMDIICSIQPEEIGIAMGINPYTDWTTLIGSLWDFNYCFDYKAFDGSLSAGLMTEASVILSQFSTDPKFVMQLAEASIYSIHHGPDYDYYLEGSNPSGTPFTTLLNCVCNLIVCEYFMLDKCEYLAVTYGDDLILSTRERVNVAEFKRVLNEEFGMNITPGDKGDVFKEVPPNEVEFLKRTPHWITTDTCVGRLNLDEMMQNIMWCRGEDAFPQQLTSFRLELSLHGEDKYNEVAKLFRDHGVQMPTYQTSVNQMKAIIYQV
nr:polyprotein [Bat picornavirus BtSY2]